MTRMSKSKAMMKMKKKERVTQLENGWESHLSAERHERMSAAEAWLKFYSSAAYIAAAEHVKVIFVVFEMDGLGFHL